LISEMIPVTIISIGWRRERSRISKIWIRPAKVGRWVYHCVSLNTERLGGRLAVPGDRRWVCERLDSMWVQREVIEIRDLKIRRP
jgi:hypothetical protein